jgi:hypothetical protein
LIEEHKDAALKETYRQQFKRKTTYDKPLKRKDIKKNDVVLLYDNKYQKFPRKLHTRWTGSYKVLNIWDNGSLQLIEIDTQQKLPTS